MLIAKCQCTSNTARVLGPNIKPLYLNASLSREDKTVTVHGRFQCPEDTETTTSIYSWNSVQFGKVWNLKENAMDCELVVNYDADRLMPYFWLKSKTTSELLSIYVNKIVKDLVQTEFSGTDCSVGLNTTSRNNTTRYTTVIHCDQRPHMLENFVMWLDKSGDIKTVLSDIYCHNSKSYREYKDYFKSRCSTDESNDPFYIEFYEDKMAADNVKLLILDYILEPVGPCTNACIAKNKQWRFQII
ncbi:uncharacterized protein LOC134269900 isoform X1 [Saccostrea cucullata]|uniref:uncharacterized protein LOC134269900 isoform X1 n=1 Tax=Saccostrea cuccullata TaxID=36930 RepID=UPI002ED40892